MQTILYQGKPGEKGHWMVLPADFVPSYKRLDYEVRELVLRAEAEQAKVEHFNAAVDQAVQLIKSEFGPVGAAVAIKKLRALKLECAETAVQS